MTRQFFPIALLLASACSSARPAGPQELVFTAKDFAFTGPDSVAPGLTAIRFVNHGTQPHHLILGQLDDGKTLQDLQAFMQQNPTGEPPFISWRGAANAIEPGDSTGSTTNLVAGHYVMLCFIPDPADNTPHVNKGMVKELVVAGAPRVAATPTAEGEIQLTEFAFAVPAVTVGTHTFHIVNAGTKTHEVQLIRLNDGVSTEQYLAALAPGAKGPPPGAFKGGPGALKPGLDDYWTVTFTPGHYLMVCFVPDTDGVPHLMKGMIRELTISAS